MTLVEVIHLDGVAERRRYLDDEGVTSGGEPESQESQSQRAKTKSQRVSGSLDQRIIGSLGDIVLERSPPL